MEPLPETRRVLAVLAEVDGSDLETDLRGVAERIADVVPSCVGVSLTLWGAELTLTFVSPSTRALTLDLAQSSHGGPCLSSAQDGEELSVPDVLDERRWQEYATAAAAEGVRSSLSVPLIDRAGAVSASLNIYAAQPRAFDGKVEQVRRLAGELAGEATTNADLPFASRRRAQLAADDLDRR